MASSENDRSGEKKSLLDTLVEENVRELLSLWEDDGGFKLSPENIERLKLIERERLLRVRGKYMKDPEE